MTKQQIIEQLKLEPHPEGGYFRRTYTHPESVESPSKRPLMSCIYYLLTDEQPIGHLHVNRSSIMHFYHCGGHLQYTLVTPDGELQRFELGAGGDYQLLVPGDWWKTSRLIEGEFALISEAVAPGFDYSDMQMIDAPRVRERHPQLMSELQASLLPGLNGTN